VLGLSYASHLWSSEKKSYHFKWVMVVLDTTIHAARVSPVLQTFRTKHFKAGATCTMWMVI
jgi:hypothetical protein